MDELAGMVTRGDLSDTAYFAVVHERAEGWVNQEALDGVALGYGELAALLVAVIAVLLVAGLVVALL
jgi:hypothetical protein